MPAKEYNEVKMRGILPSEGMNPIPVTESAPLTSILVGPKPNATSIPVGKIPDGAVQVIRSNFASNATVTLYQVTAGKTLYFCSYFFWSNNQNPAAATGQMTVTTSGDAHRFYLAYHYLPTNTFASTSLTFFPPLEITDQFKIKIQSNLGSYEVLGMFYGYEM